MPNMKKGLALLLSALAFAGAAQATAFDPSGFSGNAVEVSFAALPIDFGRPGPLSLQGVTFSSGSGNLRTYGAVSWPVWTDNDVCGVRGCIMNDADLDFISVTLSEPVMLAGAWIGIPNVATTARAEFFSGEVLLGSVDVSARAFEGVFAGWDAGADLITSVRFIDTERQDFVLGLTGFTYQLAAPVPEPSSLALLMPGLLAVGTVVRRNRARRTTPT